MLGQSKGGGLKLDLGTKIVNPPGNFCSIRPIRSRASLVFPRPVRPRINRNAEPSKTLRSFVCSAFSLRSWYEISNSAIEKFGAFSATSRADLATSKGNPGFRGAVCFRRFRQIRLHMRLPNLTNMPAAMVNIAVPAIDAPRGLCTHSHTGLSALNCDPTLLRFSSCAPHHAHKRETTTVMVSWLVVEFQRSVAYTKWASAPDANRVACSCGRTASAVLCERPSLADLGSEIVGTWRHPRFREALCSFAKVGLLGKVRLCS